MWLARGKWWARRKDNYIFLNVMYSRRLRRRRRRQLNIYIYMYIYIYIYIDINTYVYICVYVELLNFYRQ